MSRYDEIKGNLQGLYDAAQEELLELDKKREDILRGIELISPFCGKKTYSVEDLKATTPKATRRGRKVTKTTKKGVITEETKPRTVQVRIWTDSLHAIQFTPVPKKAANTYLKLKKDGRINLGSMPESFFDRFGYGQDIYFECGHNRHKLVTVIDGDNEQQFQKCPDIYWHHLQYLFQCKTETEAYEKAVDEMGDDAGEEGCRTWEWLQRVRSHINKSLDNDDDNKLETLLSLFKQSEDGELCDFARYLKLEAQKCNNNDDDSVNYVLCGNIGKGIVHFDIKVPGGEPFDINKLHLIDNNDDVLDTDEIGWNEALREIDYTSYCFMFVEYDGIIYPLDYAEFISGWKHCKGYFATADLSHSVEYDENGECDAEIEEDEDIDGDDE